MLAACGGGSGVASAGPVGSGALASDAGVGSGAVPAATWLADALNVLDAGYTFESTIGVGDKVATRAKGRWTAGSSEVTIESNGTSVVYRTIPPKSWVKQPGKSWVQVESAADDAAPLDALREPSSVSVVADRPGSLELRATYPPEALGLPSGTPVTVELLVGPEGSVVATYSSTTAGGRATSTTSLRPSPGQAPIAAP